MCRAMIEYPIIYTHTHTQDKEVEFLSFILRLNNVETLLLCGVERHVDM